MFSTAQLISMLIGVVIPLVNGVATRYGAVRLRVFLQIFLTAVSGFLTEWIGAINAHTNYNVTQAILGWIATLVTALAVEAKVWAPLGVSESLKRLGSTPTA